MPDRGTLSAVLEPVAHLYPDSHDAFLDWLENYAKDHPLVAPERTTMAFSWLRLIGRGRKMIAWSALGAREQTIVRSILRATFGEGTVDGNLTIVLRSFGLPDNRGDLEDLNIELNGPQGSECR